jgi:hypothetical protein
MSIVQQVQAEHVVDFVPKKNGGSHEAGNNSTIGYEPHRRPGILRTSVLAALACGSTAVLIYIPLLFQHTSTANSCLSKFPVCRCPYLVGELLTFVFYFHRRPAILHIYRSRRNYLHHYTQLSLARHFYAFFLSPYLSTGSASHYCFDLQDGGSGIIQCHCFLLGGSPWCRRE